MTIENLPTIDKEIEDAPEKKGDIMDVGFVEKAILQALSILRTFIYGA